MDARVTDYQSSQWDGKLRAEWRVNDQRMCAEWHGGAYIDIGPRWGRAFEVFNVWDYAAGCSRIPFTREGFRDYMRGQLSDAETVDALLNVWENSR